MKTLTELAVLCLDMQDLDAALYYHNAALSLYQPAIQSNARTTSTSTSSKRTSTENKAAQEEDPEDKEHCGCCTDHNHHDHTSTATILAILNLRHVAVIYIRNGMCHEALRCYNMIYTIQQQDASATMMEQATTTDETKRTPIFSMAERCSTLSCMGLMHYLMGNYSAALRFYQEERNLRCSASSQEVGVLGDSKTTEESKVQTELAVSHNSIGICLFQMERMPEAQTAFEACLQIRLARIEMLYNHHQNQTPSSSTKVDYETIEEQFLQKANNKNTQAASSFSNSSLTAIHDRHWYDMAMVYYNLAAIAMKMEDTANATQLYEKSMHVKQAVFGGTHPEIALDYQHLGQLYLDHGDPSTAITYYTKALQVVQAISAASSAPTATSALSPSAEITDSPTLATCMDNSSSSCSSTSPATITPTSTSTSTNTTTTWSAEQKLLVIIGNIYLLEANLEGMMAHFEQAARMEQTQGDGEYWDRVKPFGYHFYSISRMHPRCAPVA